MGNGISVKADLTGCNVAFLVPADGCLNILAFKAMEAILERGVKRVETTSLKEASLKFAKIQEEHGGIPAEQIFLKVTSKGNIIQLFF